MVSYLGFILGLVPWFHTLVSYGQRFIPLSKNTPIWYTGTFLRSTNLESVRTAYEEHRKPKGNHNKWYKLRDL